RGRVGGADRVAEYLRSQAGCEAADRRSRGHVGLLDGLGLARAAGVEGGLDLALAQRPPKDGRLVDEALEAVIEPGIGEADGQRSAIGYEGAAGCTARNQFPIEVDLHYPRAGIDNRPDMAELADRDEVCRGLQEDIGPGEMDKERGKGAIRVNKEAVVPPGAATLGDHRPEVVVEGNS